MMRRFRRFAYMFLGRQNRGRGGAILTPNELVFSFGGSYVCANFGANRSRNATVRVPATDTHIDTLTDWLIDANRFYILPHAIAMGELNTFHGTRYLHHSQIHNDRTVLIMIAGCSAHAWNGHISTSAHKYDVIIVFLNPDFLYHAETLAIQP